MLVIYLILDTKSSLKTLLYRTRHPQALHYKIMKGKLVFILFLFPLSVVSAMRFPADHRASSLGIGQQQQQQQSMNRLLQNEEESDEKTENEHLKPLKICSVLGGLDLTRLRSSEARSLFKGTIEDVELIREYVSEAITNGGLKGGLSDLQDLRNTLDWEARGLDPSLDTLTAGLGYSDDRIDRRIDRMTSSSSNLPFVGNKETDAVMMDVVSNILPWIVDRKKNEDLWFLDHQNGRNQMPGSEPLVYESLYMQAYILSWGDSIWYYPPLSQYGHPLQIADALGGGFDSHPIVKGAGFLPDENPQHLSAFYGPYPDIGIPGLALVSRRSSKRQMEINQLLTWLLFRLLSTPPHYLDYSHDTCVLHGRIHELYLQ